MQDPRRKSRTVDIQPLEESFFSNKASANENERREIAGEPHVKTKSTWRALCKNKAPQNDRIIVIQNLWQKRILGVVRKTNHTRRAVCNDKGPKMTKQ